MFSFLSKHVVLLETNKEIISTLDENVLCNSTDHEDLTLLAPCNHEEADTRIILHAAEAVSTGHKRVLIRTVDTDVVVLAVTFALQIGSFELWLGFGTGKSFHYIPANMIANTLGLSKCKSLPFFHAFTGCDTVFAFCGKELAFLELSLELSATPKEVQTQH